MSTTFFSFKFLYNLIINITKSEKAIFSNDIEDSKIKQKETDI